MHTGSEGVITYETTGSEPDRVFIVQWKRMQADAWDGSSALIDFQLHLYEATQAVEFHYGPVVNGTFAGEYAGASIGLKDHIGGDFHYYDFITDGTGRAADLTADLSPLTDWPGPDSCYSIQVMPETEAVWQTQISGTENQLYGVEAFSDTEVWAVGVNGTVLHTTDGGNAWEAVWTESDTVHFYDVETIDDNTVFILGYSIGSHQSILSSHVYKTTNDGSSWELIFYEPGTWLNHIKMFSPSEGMALGDPVDNTWVIVETTDGGDAWSQIGTAPSANEGEFSTRNAVCWVNGSTAWFGSNMSKAYRTTDRGMSWSTVDIPDYHDYMRLSILESGIGLAASGDAFQRTTDNGTSWTEMQPPDAGEITHIIPYEGVFRLLFDNAIYKSTDTGLSWELDTSTQEKIRNLSFIKKDNEIWGWGVGQNGIILKYREGVISNIEDDFIVPDRMTLAQNYPNPFNPTTTIRYTLPGREKVALIVYNMMGRKVRTLVDKIQPSGSRVISWDGRDDFGNLVGSGVYVYRLQAGTEVRTRKMVFVR
jgi:photosystem II stability/assembly factor-like uncharacterized protein